MDWSEMNCGIVEHDDDCLCDVIINEPVQIKLHDAVDEMWMGRQLCDTRDYDYPWTSDKILNYFTDLCTFYDRWSELQEQKFAHQSQPHERMVQLLRQGMKNSEIRRMIKEEYSVEYSRSAISHTKKRIGLSTLEVQ
jgi:hypothetical protein